VSLTRKKKKSRIISGIDPVPPQKNTIFLTNNAFLYLNKKQ